MESESFRNLSPRSLGPLLRGQRDGGILVLYVTAIHHLLLAYTILTIHILLPPSLYIAFAVDSSIRFAQHWFLILTAWSVHPSITWVSAIQSCTAILFQIQTPKSRLTTQKYIWIYQFIVQTKRIAPNPIAPMLSPNMICIIFLPVPFDCGLPCCRNINEIHIIEITTADFKRICTNEIKFAFTGDDIVTFEGFNCEAICASAACDWTVSRYTGNNFLLSLSFTHHNRYMFKPGLVAILSILNGPLHYLAAIFLISNRSLHYLIVPYNGRIFLLSGSKGYDGCISLVGGHMRYVFIYIVSFLGLGLDALLLIQLLGSQFNF